MKKFRLTCAIFLCAMLLSCVMLVLAEEAVIPESDAVEAPVEEVELSLADLAEDMPYDLAAEPLPELELVSDMDDDRAVLATDGSIAIDEAHFPDETFRAYIKEQTDRDKDGALSPEEIDAVTFLWLNGLDISSIEGGEIFHNVTSLSCDRTLMTSIDLSPFPGLTELNCYSVPLTQLDVSCCPHLKKLYCISNELTTLDVSMCAELEEFRCDNNWLTSLKLGAHPALVSLDCGYNHLKSLNVSKCPALVELYAGNNDALKTLDVTGCPALEKLLCNDGALTKLNVGKCPALVELYCGGNQIKTLNVSKNTALQVLDCTMNKLTKLDVSDHAALKVLACDGNKLKSLDLGGCSALVDLWCIDCKLKALDISRCPSLTWLHCEHNDFTSLDVSACPALVRATRVQPVHNINGIADYGSDDSSSANGGDPCIICDDFTAIKPRPKKAYVQACVVTVNDQTNTGATAEPKVTVKYGATTLKKGRDYALTYANNGNKGSATFVITGKGGYLDEKTVQYNFLPKAVTVLSLKAGKAQLTASWKKADYADGYQLQYGLKKNFSGAKTVNVEKETTLKQVLKKLKSGKTYYVRIRAYRKGDFLDCYYSIWSAAKKVKVK